MRDQLLPEGYRSASRGRYRLLARHDLLERLVEAGALDGAPPERWGERLADVGGGRRPLLQIRVAGYPECLLVKRVSRGGWLGRLLLDLSPAGRALRELRVVERLRSEGVETPPLLCARLERRLGLARIDLATPLLDSARDLSRWFQEGRPPSERRRILATAGRQVAAMHRAGVIHQDLNLRNLLVDGAGQVHLIDLGRSRRGPAQEGRRVANLARLYRSAVKWGLASSVVRGTDLVRFLEGYRPEGWKDLFRQVRASFRRTLPCHRLSWWLSGHGERSRAEASSHQDR